MSRLKRPSGPYVISILALFTALVVPAYAALSKGDKKTVKNLANAEITKRAPGLAVASANTASTANNANTLDGKDASDFAAAGEVHTQRFVTNDPDPSNAGDLGFEKLTDIGPVQVWGECYEIIPEGSGPDQARALVRVPAGSSLSGVRSTTGDSFVEFDEANEPGGVDILLATTSVSPETRRVRGGHAIITMPGGEVVFLAVSAEVQDSSVPNGDC